MSNLSAITWWKQVWYGEMMMKSALY